MEAKLIVIGGKANKSEIKLKLPTTIGRSRKADLTVAHPKVSRQHCEIFERDGVLVVKDFGSLNGTFIDNARITEAILKPGDKLTVGPLTFVAVYHHVGPLPVAPPDPADLPTPAISPIELPAVMARVGRGAGDAVTAAQVKPMPRPVQPRTPLPPQPPAETIQSPASEPLLPATLAANAPEPEPESDAEDFSWLTGDAGPSPPADAEAAPPPAPAYAETVNLNRQGSAAASHELLDAPADDLGFSVSAAAAAPEGDSHDFSWLDDAQDQPLDFSAFEGNGKSVPAAASAEPEKPAVDLGRTMLQNPGPTLEMPKPAPIATPDPSPAEAVDDSSADEESELPSIVADTPAATKSASGSKAADKKAWWPFPAKQKSAGPPTAPTPVAVDSLEELPEEEELASQPAAPQFIPPPAAKPSEPTTAGNGEDDQALDQFFKSLH